MKYKYLPEARNNTWWALPVVWVHAIFPWSVTITNMSLWAWKGVQHTKNTTTTLTEKINYIKLEPCNLSLKMHERLKAISFKFDLKKRLGPQNCTYPHTRCFYNETNRVNLWKFCGKMGFVKSNLKEMNFNYIHSQSPIAWFHFEDISPIWVKIRVRCSF